MTSAEDRLTPLSNDPESLTEFAITIGLDESCFRFAELFGFDDDLLAFIPRPVYSTIFLFPMGSEEGAISKRHQDVVDQVPPIPWFTRQTVANACGTIAVIHSILNNLSVLKIGKDSWLETFIRESAEKSPEERASMIEDSDELLEIHEENAVEDTTPIDESSFCNHFITFVVLDGKMWELDGLKPQPFCHGPCRDLLKESVGIIQRDFLPHIEDAMQVSICAFCGPET